MRRGEKTPDDLDRPAGNSLVENYDKHDVGHQAFVDRITDEGYTPYEWGIDRRHDADEEGVIYDDAMDFKVFRGLRLKALVDVKVKSREYYMGEYNERHYLKYYGHTDEYDVPIFVVFFQVDTSASGSGDSGSEGDQVDGDDVEDCFVSRVDEGGIDDNIETTSEDDIEPFPDHNYKARVPEDARMSWDEMVEQL
jgi:hypothetical protein